MTFAEAKFKRTLSYEGALTAPQVTAMVDVIRGIDKFSESKKKQWGILAACGGVGGLIIGYLLVEFVNEVLGGLIIIGGIAFGVFAFRAMKRYGRMDFADERYELLNSVAKMLARDMTSNELLQVRLDLTRPNERDKYVRKGKAGHWDVKYYEDPWLTMTGQFLDGTKYQLLVVEKFQARDRWKRSRSGKSKHKSKSKTGTAAVLRLKPKSSKVADWTANLDANQKAIQLPDWVEFKGLQEEGDVLVLKVGTKTPWAVPATRAKSDGVEMVSMMFLSLYQIVNLSKAVAKAKTQE